jgi:hypothetical protein
MPDGVVEPPALTEVKAPERSGEHVEVAPWIRHRRLRYGVINPVAVVFEIVDVETKSTETEKMVEQLPHYAGERITPRKMQNHDSSFAYALHDASHVNVGSLTLAKSPFAQW